MIAEQWVDSILKSKIRDDKIMLGDFQHVDIDTFCTFFRFAIEDDTQADKYVALSNSHTFMWGEQQYTKTAQELGYQKYFDQWHQEGII